MRIFSIFTLLSLLFGHWLVVTPPAYAANNVLTNAALSTVLILAMDRNDEIIGHGSGVLIALGGLVLTNYHVIEANQQRDGRVAILVPNSPTASRYEDFTAYWGSVLAGGSDSAADLALVQIAMTDAEEALPASQTFPTLHLGDSDQLTIGDAIHVLGYPGIGRGSLITTPGSVIGFQEEEGLPWVLTNAVISGGNSGGAVINQAGELVAIPTMTITDPDSGNTFGYLRPINLAQPLIRQARIGSGPVSPVEASCADDFTSNKNGWPLGLDHDDLLTSETVIAGGTYQKSVHFKQDAYTWATAPDCEVKDFSLQVDATVLQASDVDTGIVLLLRHKERAGQYSHYRVIYYLDNSYEIDLRNGNEWQTFQERTPTRWLNLAPGETNRLAVLVVGTQITVYANGEQITSVLDDTLFATGEIGLGLIGNAEQQIEVAFDNFRVESHIPPGVIFYDFFVDNHNAWELGRLNDADVDCEDKIVNGRLEHRITLKTDPNSCLSHTPTLVAQDFWLTVDATWLDSIDKGSWLSILFRYDDKSGHQYDLRIDDQGNYILERYYNEAWQTLQDWTQSAAINLGKGQTNTIQLWVRGPYITLTINDVELITVEDDQLPGAGQIMPGVGGDTGVSTLVAYDNLIVRQTPPIVD